MFEVMTGYSYVIPDGGSALTDHDAKDNGCGLMTCEISWSDVVGSLADRWAIGVMIPGS